MTVREYKGSLGTGFALGLALLGACILAIASVNSGFLAKGIAAVVLWVAAIPGFIIGARKARERLSREAENGSEAEDPQTWRKVLPFGFALSLALTVFAPPAFSSAFVGLLAGIFIAFGLAYWWLSRSR